MKESSPGLHPDRLVRLMREAVQRCKLNLSGAVVLTEAASGSYVVTPLLAALAGARRVYALTRSGPYGSVEAIAAHTRGLALQAGVADQIRVVTEKRPDLLTQADIVTNSGHVRPLDATLIAELKPSTVIPLMYESWEFRPGEVDLESCRRRGIAVAGTNERHPAVDVFSYLGSMALKLLLGAGVAVYRSRILLVCDNPFASFLQHGLSSAGAAVEWVKDLEAANALAPLDAILVALKPRPRAVIGAVEAATIAGRWPGAVVAQFWGDLDRAALTASRVPYWPREAPVLGHMGILPSDVGPEPVVRLQAGGLKVAEVLRHGGSNRAGPGWEYVDPL